MKDKNILVSVIIPVYNTQAYLKSCLDSVIQQSYKNLEIIIVNDGSKDESPQICEKYAQLDKRIKVIHQENGGLSHARNTGIGCASGAFLIFIDSDDYVHEKYVEILLENCIQHQCDVGIVNYARVVRDGEETDLPKHLKVECVSNIQASMRIYDYPYYIRTITAWGKIFRKELVEAVRFPVGKVYEDEGTIYKLLYDANKVVYIDADVYYYRQNPNGIILSGFTEKKFEYFGLLNERLKFYEEKCETELYKLTLNRKYFDMLLFINRARLYIPSSEELQKKWRKEQWELFKILIKRTDFSVGRKIRYIWGMLSPATYCKINHLK